VLQSIIHEFQYYNSILCVDPVLVKDTAPDSVVTVSSVV
jgi:hypothetical protein